MDLEDRLTKKDKLDIDLLSTVTTPPLHPPKKVNNPDKMGSIIKADFISWFSEVLDEEVVKEKLKSVREVSIEEIHMRIDDMELQNEDRDERAKILQTRVDNLEQAKMSRNLILTGTDCKPTIAAVVRKLNSLLDTTLKNKTFNM